MKPNVLVVYYSRSGHTRRVAEEMAYLDPLTRLANSVIDGVVAAPGPVAAEVEKYLGTDMLFYRAAGPDGLAAAHARLERRLRDRGGRQRVVEVLEAHGVPLSGGRVRRRVACPPGAPTRRGSRRVRGGCARAVRAG